MSNVESPEAFVAAIKQWCGEQPLEPSHIVGWVQQRDDAIRAGAARLHAALEEAEDVLADILGQREGDPRRYDENQVKDIHVRVLEALKE